MLVRWDEQDLSIIKSRILVGGSGLKTQG